jgi:hypothetical protein
MSTDPLEDVERVQKLAVDIVQAIRENYRRGPMHKDRVYEALNALAFAVALVLQGANDAKAKEFFDAALARNRNPMDPGKKLN